MAEAEVELVIKIPKDIYNRVAVTPRCATALDAFRDRDMFCKAIQEGIKLPPNHGNLVDIGEYQKRLKAKYAECDAVTGSGIALAYEMAHGQKPLIEANREVAKLPEVSEDKEDEREI